MTLMMTSAQVVETSVNVTNNSPSRDYSHPDDQTTQTSDNYNRQQPIEDMRSNERGNIDQFLAIAVYSRLALLHTGNTPT